MNYRALGLTIGVTVGLVLCVVIFKFWNKDGKVKTKYDEKQEKVRGKAYMYSFWTLAACELIVSVLDGFGVKLFSDLFVANLSCIIIAALVNASYSVGKDAYMGLNTHYKRFTIVMILVGIVNAMSAIAGFASGSMLVDGVLQPPFTNLMCAIIFIAIGIELFVRNSIAAREEEED